MIHINIFMTNITSSDDLDALTKELLDTQYLTNDVVLPSTIKSPPEPVDVPELTDDNVNDYILKKSAEILENAMIVSNELKDSILSSNTVDPDTLNAYSGVLKTLNLTISNLNKINIQNKKDNTSRQLKTIKGPQTINNVLITGSRDEIIKKYIENKQEPIPLPPALSEDESFEVN